MSNQQAMNSSSQAPQTHIPVDQNEHPTAAVIKQTNNDLDWSQFVPKMENMTDVFSFGCSTALVFGGLVPYIPQYIKIKNSGSSDGFSTYVCLTLLLANILRIAFWFGHRFELPLLIQSFVMIAGMMALMEVCIRVRRLSSSYVIPSVRANSSRTKRSLIGKIFSRVSNETVTDSDHQNGLNNESTPIYSVTASSSSPESNSVEPALLNFVVNRPSISVTEVHRHQASDLEPKPYHEQESVDIEGAGETLPRNALSTHDLAHSSNNSQDSNSIMNSFRDNESPILNQIHIEPDTYMQTSPSGSDPSSVSDHSYSNNYLSAQRYKRSGLVKWLTAHHFWDWDDLFSYVKFLSYFTLALGILTYTLLDYYVYIEGLGYVALFTEAILGIPQLARNFQKKSTLGMSVHMVIMWLSGDLFKTLYCILRKQPAQFVACGSIQVIIDILILGQVFWYKRPKVTYRRLPKVT